MGVDNTSAVSGDNLTNRLRPRITSFLILCVCRNITPTLWRTTTALSNTANSWVAGSRTLSRRAFRPGHGRCNQSRLCRVSSQRGSIKKATTNCLAIRSAHSWTSAVHEVWRPNAEKSETGSIAIVLLNIRGDPAMTGELFLVLHAAISFQARRKLLSWGRRRRKCLCVATGWRP